MCGPFVSDLLSGSLLKMYLLSLSHPDSDSVSPGKEGSFSYKLIDVKKLVSQVILMHLKYENHWPFCSVQIGNMNLTDTSSYSFTHPLLIQFLAPYCSQTELSKALMPSVNMHFTRLCKLHASGSVNSRGSRQQSSLLETPRNP